MCQITRTIGTLENDKFKIMHGFPVRLQKEALHFQQFSISIFENKRQ
jgi:hypothetical protein